MRNGQNNKRMRPRNNNHNSNNNNNNNNRRGQNPLTRVFESNGPDIKIRGNASHIAEKYVQLARDARSSGDPVAAENYYQHAEHYFRLIAAAQEQFRQNQPQQPRIDNDTRDGAADEGDIDGFSSFGSEPGLAPAPQREVQQPREQHQRPPREPRPQPAYQPQPQPVVSQLAAQPVTDGEDGEGHMDRLPSFITGAPSLPLPLPDDAAASAPNGRVSDRYPPRRRRRPATPRAASAAAEPVSEDINPGE